MRFIITVDTDIDKEASLVDHPRTQTVEAVQDELFNEVHEAIEKLWFDNTCYSLTRLDIEHTTKRK